MIIRVISRIKYVLSQAPHPPRWIPCINTRLSDVFRNYRPSANHHVITNAHWEDRGIGSNRNVVPDMGRLPQFFFAHSRSSCLKEVIDEHHPMPNKAMIADVHQFADKGMGLHLTMTPYNHIFLNLYKGTYEGMIANFAPVDINRFYNRYVFPEIYIYNAYLMGFIVHF